jgi:cytochrome bd ubiquinol oxidase subunit II
MGTGALLLLSLALLVFLIAVFVYALSENLQVMERWLELPVPFSFLLSTGAAAAAVVLAASVVGLVHYG